MHKLMNYDIYYMLEVELKPDIIIHILLILPFDIIFNIEFAAKGRLTNTHTWVIQLFNYALGY